MKRVIVVGAGASGLMAAASAAEQGAQVVVLEKNEKTGKKIYITGKGRCNLTNDCETSEFFDHVVSNPKFLYSAVYGFDHDAVKEFMERNQCRVKQERGMRVFPVSDHASDVTRALVNAVTAAGGKILCRRTVRKLIFKDGRAAGVMLSDGTRMDADAVIVCTGGLSYSSTGSTGDGYRFAEEAGHKVTEPEPSLVAFRTAENWPASLAGLTLKNISVRVEPIDAAGDNEHRNAIKEKKKKIRPVYEGFGELLFTHSGVSGPLVLTASSRCSFRKYPEGYRMFLDLKPMIPDDEFQDRINGLLESAPDKQFCNAVSSLFPARLTGTVVPLSGIDGSKAARQITKAEITRFIGFLHSVPLTIISTGGFEEAVITRGGVSVREIDPSTMESKLVSGLYFAGEVIDVDAVTGGFNLQIAWSTGHLAGASAAI